MSNPVVFNTFILNIGRMNLIYGIVSEMDHLICFIGSVWLFIFIDRNSSETLNIAINL